jgi:hypothetical protein
VRSSSNTYLERQTDNAFDKARFGRGTGLVSPSDWEFSARVDGQLGAVAGHLELGVLEWMVVRAHGARAGLVRQRNEQRDHHRPMHGIPQTRSSRRPKISSPSGKIFAHRQPHHRLRQRSLSLRSGGIFRGLAGQTVFDRGILLAADIRRDAGIDRIVCRACEFQFDQRFALGEQEHRHRLRFVRRSAGNH